MFVYVDVHMVYYMYVCSWYVWQFVDLCAEIYIFYVAYFVLLLLCIVRWGSKWEWVWGEACLGWDLPLRFVNAYRMHTLKKAGVEGFAIYQLLGKHKIALMQPRRSYQSLTNQATIQASRQPSIPNPNDQTTKQPYRPTIRP